MPEFPNKIESIAKKIEYNESEKEAILELENFVREKMENVPERHGFNHINKVRNYAVEICKEEEGDLFATEVAALAHDLGRAVEEDSEKKHHALLSLYEVHDFLQQLYSKGVMSIDTWRKVSSAIAKHSELPKKETELTQKIIRDADRLDGLGINGMIRALEHARDRKLPFYSEGEKIFYKEEEVAEKAKTAIGNINFVYDWRKILELDVAKKIAEPNLKIMHQFLSLFDNHKEMQDYDFWIIFLKFCQKNDIKNINEEALLEFKKFSE